METPLLKVGIMAEKEIFFSLDGNYHFENTEEEITGKCKAIKTETGICLECGEKSWINPDALNLIPSDPESGNFKLNDVTIGINFHWERKEDQIFKGGLYFVSARDKIQAINALTIEDYLISVISSEMSATSSMELLKAHAVISRSWLLAQVQKSKNLLMDKQKYQTLSYF